MITDDGLMAEWLHLAGVAIYDGFRDANDVAKHFEVQPQDIGGILAAIYNREGYEGNALVVYVRDGKLYEANGSHCSCNGLEGQWSEEETSVPALRKRGYPRHNWRDGNDYISEAEQRWLDLLDMLESMGVGKV